MSYDPTVPQANQFISTSQPIIQGNFNKLNVDFGVDHNANTTPLLNGNGEHKKITFTNVGTPPYPILGTKSYAYSKFVDPVLPGTLTYVEYQSGGTDVISGLAPLSPMTPRAVLYGVTTAVPACTILRSFNVASAILVGGNANITFQEPMADLNYLVLNISEVIFGSFFLLSNKTLTGFSMFFGAPPGAGIKFGFVVF